jgi:hypothetical protein
MPSSGSHGLARRCCVISSEPYEVVTNLTISISLGCYKNGFGLYAVKCVCDVAATAERLEGGWDREPS